ncbi:hypothetical protein GOHSU_04_01120 [Gordonia hirsuta DSM 44140 = NBRC 16056]|uniref:Lipase n=1 Tax=Gordonia hirsuta DSM 44140 = NBRC 16056 TaxID=1121927 RepID=L7L888_9ACTN|nr:hypothetical protein [Gordonia hirsuta]GAC56243.1 hypothetical protein GOHSU_04_01120 [Gordonia hirsuta DSM 44140 = NBRC 16056]
MTPRQPRLRKTLAATTAAAALTAGILTATQAFADPEAARPATGSPGQTAGAVFANQPLPTADLPAAAVSGQRYSYWTEGTDDRMHLAVATMLEPKGKAPAGGWPVVVNAPAGYGLGDDCNASTNSKAGDPDTAGRLLRNGFAVITPDYGIIGDQHSPQYINHAVAAQNMVDAVLAGVVVDGSVSPRWAVLGEAQGAAAAITLARKATDQKNATDFRGAAATSIPAGVDVLISSLSPTSPAASEAVTADVVYALASLEADQVEPLLTKKGRELVGKAATLCKPDLQKQVRGVALGDLMLKPVSSSPKLQAKLKRSLELPRNGYSRPLLLSQTLQDDSILLHEALRFLAEAQLSSNKVQAVSYLTGDPVDAQRQEQAAVLKYLDGLF